MATPSISPDTTLQLKRTFQAPRERVYRAWTDPEEMKELGSARRRLRSRCRRRPARRRKIPDSNDAPRR